MTPELSIERADDGQLAPPGMARNVEIKARIVSVEALRPRVAELASEGPIEIAQDDTFFRCQTGHLKLRDLLNGSGELIFYRRAHRAGPRESFYLRSCTSTPEVLRESLLLAYGQLGRVVKHRTLFVIGRTRVHLDKVDGLGHFVELEVVLGQNEPSEAGVDEAHELMGRLGIEPSQLIEEAYVELLAKGATDPSIGADGVPAASHPSGAPLSPWAAAPVERRSRDNLPT